MKRLLPYSIVLIAAIILGACAAGAVQSEPEYAVEAPGQPAMDIAPAPGVEESASRDASGGGGEAASVERIVIQNADLAIVVSDVEGRMVEIQKMAEEKGGFVVSSNLYQGYTSTYVPVPEGALEDIREFNPVLLAGRDHAAIGRGDRIAACFGMPRNVVQRIQTAADALTTLEHEHLQTGLLEREGRTKT